MSLEANKTLVQSYLEGVWSGDVSIMEQHSGLRHLIPFVQEIIEANEHSNSKITEQFGEGEWVATRFVSDIKLKKDFRGMEAGSQVTIETLMMHHIVDGEIVLQYAQGAPI